MIRALIPLTTYGLPVSLLIYSICSVDQGSKATEKEKAIVVRRAEVVQIERAGRHPFVAAAEPEIIADIAAEKPAEMPPSKTVVAGLQLSGVCIAGKKRLAVIGANVYSEGMQLEKLADAHITEIRKNEVVVQAGSESFTISYSGTSASARGSQEGQLQAAGKAP
jgi:hypothetical protein